jgi:replicative DNA helicase
MATPLQAARDGKLAPSPKHPPHSMEAEQSVLGGLLLNNRAWPDVRALLSAEDFYTQDHRVIFFAIGDLAEENEPFDFVTVSQKIREQGNADASTLAYLGTLAADTPSAANVLAYARIVQQMAQLRGLIAAGLDIAGWGYEPGDHEPGELIGKAEHRIAALQRHDAGEIVTLREVIGEAMDAARARATRREAGEDYGATTGLPAVDECLGAFARGCFYIIAARPGTGKTAFLSQIAVHSARRGFPGLMLSLEMSRTQLGARAAASIARTNVTGILRGYRDEIGKAERGLTGKAETMRLPVYIDTDTSDLQAIVARMYEAKRRYGIQWAAVDHIGLVQGMDSKQSRDRQIGEVTWTLKRTAKRLDIAVIGLSQLTRANEKDGRPPVLSDLRDSGNIEQDADLVIFLHTPPNNATGDYPREFGLFKNRDGREGWLGTPHDRHKFWFNGREQRFYEQAPEGYDDGL